MNEWIQKFKSFRTATKVLVLVALLNFAAFFISCMVLGGDALNGHITAGHYFLASHGKLTETSEAVFRYSRLHAISVFITHPLAMIAMWLDGGKSGPR